MATERAHTSADDNGAGLGGARGGGPSRRADRDLTTGLRLRVGAAGASAGRGSRREAGYVPAAGASRRGRDDYFVELTLGQSIVLVLVLLLAHVAGLLAIYWRGTSTIMQHRQDCTRRHQTAVKLLTAEFESQKEEWNLQAEGHKARQKECEQIVMGERTHQNKELGEDMQDVLSRPSQAAGLLKGHIRSRCECSGEESDAKLQYEYSRMRDRYLRLESEHNSLKAREMRMIERLPKLAQYEVAALPQPWTAHLHPSGRTFYFNHESGLSSWHDPRQVPLPKVESCPGFPASLETDRFAESGSLDDNVGSELWGEKKQGAVGMAAGQPSEAKLTGQQKVVHKETLSESDSHLPAHSFSPASEIMRTTTRQSGITIDTPRGSRMQGKLQVTGPTLVTRHEEELTDERVKDQAVFRGEAKMVFLDGDRLWLSIADTAVAPWEQQARNFAAAGGPDLQADPSEAVSMQSIPLWKADLEILYPAHQDDVSDLLWVEDRQPEHDRKSGGSHGKSIPQVYQRSFTRFRILDRLSRYWVFQSRSKLDARDWVSSLTHNILLVDSGRIRPTNFHILAPRPGNAAAQSSTSNMTAQMLLDQIQADLRHCTHMLHHSESQLGNCRKEQALSLRCDGMPQNVVAQAESRPLPGKSDLHNAPGALFGSILEGVDAPKQGQERIRQVKQLLGLASSAQLERRVGTDSALGPATSSSDDLLASPAAATSATLSSPSSPDASPSHTHPNSAEATLESGHSPEKMRNLGETHAGGREHRDVAKLEDLEFKLKQVLLASHAPTRQSSPSLYPKYMSFLGAQAKAPGLRIMCMFGFGLGHVPLHLLLSSSRSSALVQEDPMLLVVDELSGAGQLPAAQMIAADPKIGPRLLVLRGSPLDVTARLAADLPQLVCDINLVIPHFGSINASLPNTERWQDEEQETKLRRLILCSGALTDEERHPGDARQTEDYRRMVDALLDDSAPADSEGSRRLLIVDGWPCGHARCQLIGRVWQSLVAQDLVLELARYPLASGKHGFVVGRYRAAAHAACASPHSDASAQR